MPKLKSNRGARKRFKVTATGKIMRNHAYKSHILTKKKQHVIHVKEVKFRPKTEEHDYQFKKRHAEEFLSKNNKVKFTVMFRGRELDHKELGEKILVRLQNELAHVGQVERPPAFEGRFMTMVMAPLPQKQSGKGRATAKEEESEGKNAEAEVE